MAIGDLPLLQMMRTRMKWHNVRQNVLAENVANADTPGFSARDVRPPQFDVPRAGGVGPIRTDARHMATFGAASNDMRPRAQNNFETTPRGNAVSLEDEMIKVGQNQMDYQAAASIYQRGISMLRMAVGRRGG
jgi:flagellar basal-body rod protein FlgB